VVTNYHVITDASDIRVSLTNGEEFSARVVGVDQDKDIAVLQIGPSPPADGLPGDRSTKPQALLSGPPSGSAAAPPPTSSAPPSGSAATSSARASEPLQLQSVSLCSSSSEIVVGQKVFAIGNPFGLDHTLTTGEALALYVRSARYETKGLKAMDARADRFGLHPQHVCVAHLLQVL
jgi:hypothetical protein